MIATTPVDKVIDLLVDAGFRRLPTPLAIAGFKFDVPGALVGTDKQPDLIVVTDTAFDTGERIKNKIEAIARALDVVQSKRPLTAVLTGPRPSTHILDSISKVCRVLPVGALSEADVVAMGDADQEAGLRNWLAVLLPLKLPQTTDATADPIDELVGRLDGKTQFVADMLTAAQYDAERVDETFVGLISEALRSEEAEL